MQGPTTFQIIVQVLLLLGLGYALGGWLRTPVRGLLERSHLDAAVRDVLVGSVRPLVLTLAALAALRVLRVDPTGALIVLAAVALAATLASREIVASLVSGVVLRSKRPYRVGDRVEVGHVEGVVLEIGWLGTTLKTSDGAHCHVSHAQVLAEPIHNRSLNGARRIGMTLLVTPASDARRARDEVVMAVFGVEGALADPPPLVTVNGLDAEGAELLLTAWAEPEAERDVRERLLLQCQDALTKAKITLVATAPTWD